MRKVSAFFVAAGAALVAILISSSSPMAQPVTGGGGLTKVTHDTSLAGSGTSTNPLGLRRDCQGGEILKWSGAVWNCQPDIPEESYTDLGLLTANTIFSDWAPTGIQVTSLLTLQASDDSGTIITGIDSTGITVGDIKTICNTGGLYDAAVVSLTNLDPRSLAANRIMTPGADYYHAAAMSSDFYIGVGECARLRYSNPVPSEPTLFAWVVMDGRTRFASLATQNLQFYPPIYTIPITGTNNNYEPIDDALYTCSPGAVDCSLSGNNGLGDSSSMIHLITTDSTGATLTGLHYPDSEVLGIGPVKILYNAGPGPVTLLDQSAGSTVLNRFDFGSGISSIVMAANGPAVILYHQRDTGAWIEIGHSNYTFDGDRIRALGGAVFDGTDLTQPLGASWLTNALASNDTTGIVPPGTVTTYVQLMGRDEGSYAAAGVPGGTVTAYGVIGVANATATTGGVSNYGGYFTASGGGTNTALYTDAGNVWLNIGGGSTLMAGDATVWGGMTIGNAAGDAHALTGTLTLNGDAGADGEVISRVAGVPTWVTASGGSYTAGDGLLLTGSDFDVTPGTGITITGDAVTANLTGASCSVGSYMSALGATGTGTCTAEVGDISGITVTAPISGAAASGSAALALTLCAATEIYKVNAGGTAWECSADAGGTSYTAGDGLTLTGSDFDITYTSDFTISTDQLDLSTAVTAPGAVSVAGNFAAGDAATDAHSIYGTVAGRSDDTFFGWDAASSPRIGFMKKVGAVGKLAYGSANSFAITQSNGTGIEASGTFTDRFTLDSSGDATFSGAVSVNGNTTLGNAVTDTATAAGVFTSGDTRGVVLVPATTTGTYNDYDPTNLATARTLIITTTGETILTGIAGGADGRMLTIVNATGAANLLLFDDSASSTAANRIYIGGRGGSFHILTNSGSVTLVYDGTASRWRMISWADDYLPSLGIGDNLTVNGSSTFGDANADGVSITGRAHYSGTAPTLSACTGATISADSTDSRGTIVFENAANSTVTCTLTFSIAYTTNKPACVISLEDGGDITGGIDPYFSSVSTSAFTVVPNSGDFDGWILHYHCDGKV